MRTARFFSSPRTQHGEWGVAPLAMRRIAESSFQDFSTVMSQLATVLGVTVVLQPGERRIARPTEWPSVEALEALLAALAQSHSSALHALLGASRGAAEERARRLGEAEARATRCQEREAEESAAARRAIEATKRIVEEMQLQQAVLTEQQQLIKTQHDEIGRLSAENELGDDELRRVLDRTSMQSGALEMQLEEKSALMRIDRLQAESGAREQLEGAFVRHTRALEAALSEHAAEAAARKLASAALSAAHEGVCTERDAARATLEEEQTQAAALELKWNAAAESMRALRGELATINAASALERDDATETRGVLETELTVARAELNDALLEAAASWDEGHYAAMQLAEVAAAAGAAEAKALRAEVAAGAARCAEQATIVDGLRRKCAALAAALETWSAVAAASTASSVVTRAALAQEEAAHAATAAGADTAVTIAARVNEAREAETQALRLSVDAQRAALTDEAQQVDALRSDCSALRACVATSEGATAQSHAAHADALDEALRTTEEMGAHAEAHSEAIDALAMRLEGEHADLLASTMTDLARDAAEAHAALRDAGEARAAELERAVAAAVSEGQRAANKAEAATRAATERSVSAEHRAQQADVRMLATVDALHLAKVAAESQIGELAALVDSLSARHAAHGAAAGAEITRLETQYSAVVKAHEAETDELVLAMSERHLIALSALDKQHALSASGAHDRYLALGRGALAEREREEHFAVLERRDAALVAALAQKKEAFVHLAAEHRRLLECELGGANGARVVLADALAQARGGGAAIASAGTTALVVVSNVDGGTGGGADADTVDDYAPWAYTPAALVAQARNAAEVFAEYKTETERAWAAAEAVQRASKQLVLERAESSEAAVVVARENCSHVAAQSARLVDTLAKEHAAAQEAAAHALRCVAGELSSATARERSAASDVEIQAEIAAALRVELAAAEACVEGAGAEATAHAARALAAEAAHIETCANARRTELAQRVASGALAAAIASQRIEYATALTERVASERTAAHNSGLRLLRAAEAERVTATHARTAAALEAQSAELAVRLCAASRRSLVRSDAARSAAAADDDAARALEIKLCALEERTAQPATLGAFLTMHDEYLTVELDADATALQAAGTREEEAVAAEARAALCAQIGRAATQHTVTLLAGRRAAAHRYQLGKAKLRCELGAHEAARAAAQREHARVERELRDALASAATAHATALTDAIADTEGRAAAELERERSELRIRASEFALSALEQLQSSQRHAADLTESIAEQRATALELASVECVAPRKRGGLCCDVCSHCRHRSLSRFHIALLLGCCPPLILLLHRTVDTKSFSKS